jgi:osmoprotectant transport system permease protein
MDFFSEVRTYLDINHEAVVQSLVDHIWLALLPVAIAFVLSLPIGWAVVRFGWIRHPILTLTSIIYTVPSLALLLLLPGILHTSFLDPLNVVVALSAYSLALLVRTVVDGLESIDDQGGQSATPLGYRPTPRWFTVELPRALPVILSGLRVATVANISMVTVAALIGIGGLGQLFTRGFQLGFYAPPIAIGLFLCVLLAILADTAIILVQRLVTPWTRAGDAR